MEFESKVKHKVLSAQSREIISSLINFMRDEAILEAPVIPFQRVNERVSAATGISIRTISRISMEAKKIEKGEAASFRTPNAKRPNRRKKNKDPNAAERAPLRKVENAIEKKDITPPSIQKVDILVKEERIDVEDNFDSNAFYGVCVKEEILEDKFDSLGSVTVKKENV